VQPYVIETEGLSKSFGTVNALQGVNLKVPKNSIFGFLGPNGAGKTTLIKLLLGLNKPTAGGGKIMGLDMVNDSVEIRKKIGYLAQHPSYYDHMTAREVLRFKASIYNMGEVEILIEESLALVGLEDLADRCIKKFSGGEMQRLGIAQAHISRPELLILDEPAASLDPMGRRDVLEIMDALKQHSTVFYSTHILDDVQRVSDMVAILNHGKLVSQAPIETLLNGGSETRYTVKIKHDPEPAYKLLLGQPWVSTVELKTGAPSTISIAVSDEEMAEENLLKLLVGQAGATVLDCRRTVFELEDIFIKLVEAEQ
jgi:ABC-2 type transport system ATP-binding protein